jgi:hypothetical protein
MDALGIGGADVRMSKGHAIFVSRNLDGSWRWQVRVPNGRAREYMKGFAQSETEAEKAAGDALARFEREKSN